MSKMAKRSSFHEGFFFDIIVDWLNKVPLKIITLEKLYYVYRNIDHEKVKIYLKI